MALPDEGTYCIHPGWAHTVPQGHFRRASESSKELGTWPSTRAEATSRLLWCCELRWPQLRQGSEGGNVIAASC